MAAPDQTESHALAAATESARVRAPVTDRVNAEPAILNGMTVTEAKMIALASSIVFGVIGGLIFAVTRVWQAFLLLLIFGPGVTLWFSSTYLQRIKRGRPESYYTQAIHLWMAQHSLAKPNFIQHGGYWDLGRSLDFSLASPLDFGADASVPASAPPTRKEPDHERT